MAVIREQRQFKIGPIGVARASEGGRTVGQALAESADQVAGRLFKRAAQDAEKAGLDYAKSVAVDQIRGIDPHTGAPVALNNIKEMGRIQAQAYERIIQQRFESSIEEEIRQKSSEFAMRYEDPRAFEAAMGNHIQEMAKNATGQYSSFISEVGTIWTGRASLALQEQAINRARAAAASAAKDQQNRLEETAYHLGTSEANGDTTASGQFGAMTRAQLRLDREVRTFGGGGADSGRAAPRLTATASKNTEANASYAAGYLMSSLVGLTNADRNAIQAQLLHSVPMAMSPAAQKVYARVSEMVPSPERLAKMGAAIKADVTSLNSSFPNMTGDFTTAYVSATNRLTAANEDNGFLHTGVQDLELSVDIINALSSSPDDADVVGSERFNARLKQLKQAQEDAASGAIISIADMAKFSAEELDAVRSGLQSRNPSALLSLARAKGVPVSDSTSVVLAELLSVIDKPTEALAVLESRETYLAGIDLREEQRHTEFIKNNSDNWISRVANGELDPETIISEFGPQISKSKEYRKFVGQLGDAVHIGALRDFVSNSMIITDSEMMKEVGLLVADDNVRTPLLQGAGFRDDIVSMLGNIKDPTVRKQVVNALQEDAPNITVQEQRLQDATRERYRELINTSDYSTKTVNQVVIYRDSMINTIRGDQNLTESDKDSFIAELNKEAGKAIASKVIAQEIDFSRLDQAAAYVASGGKLKGDLTQNEIKQLNNIVGTYSTEADREAIAANVSVKIERLQAADAEKRKNNEITAAMSVWNDGNGGIISFDAVDEIMAGLVRRFGIAVPPDAITDAQKYIAAAGNISSADYKAGLLVKEMLEKSNRIMLPPVRDYFRYAAAGGFAAAQLENAGKLWAYSGMDTRARSQAAAASGLSPDEIGILETLSQHVSNGIPTTYLDEIQDALRSPQASEDAFVQKHGSRKTDSVNAYIISTMPTEVGTDPALLKFYAEYALGISRAGASSSQLKSTLKSHFKDAFYNDSLTSNISSPALGKVHVGVRRAFNNDIPSVTAAIQLWHVDQWALIGSKYKDLSLRDQILRGKSDFEQQFKRIWVSPNLSSMPIAITQKDLVLERADLGNKLTYTFVARTGSQNHNAEFNAFTLDQNGQLGAAPFASGLKSNNAKVRLFADELLKDQPVAGTMDDRAIDFWIRSRK